MKWRWRRRVKVAPGVTVNLTNSSAGVTLGGPAGRVSINNRGRITAGQSIPGTGLYSQTTLATGKRQPTPYQVVPEIAPPRKRRGCLFYSGIGLALLVGLALCGSLLNLRTPTTPTAALRGPTPTATPEPPTPTALPPTPEPPTATPLPIPTGPVANDNANLREGPGAEYPVIGNTIAGQVLEPVGRNSAGDWLQLASGAWIAAALVDNAPGGLPVTAVTAQLGNPTAPAAAATPGGWMREERGVIFQSDCPCDQGDVLNCDDFPIDRDGQACYLRCQDLVGIDVHRLDRDQDGSACEWSW